MRSASTPAYSSAATAHEDVAPRTTSLPVDPCWEGWWKIVESGRPPRGALRRGARAHHRHHHSDLVDHDGRVLDEHAVRQVLACRERDDTGAAATERVLILLMLAQRQRSVDRRVVDVRALAELHPRRRRARYGDEVGVAHGSSRGASIKVRNCSRAGPAPTKRSSGNFR